MASKIIKGVVRECGACFWGTHDTFDPHCANTSGQPPESRIPYKAINPEASACSVFRPSSTTTTTQIGARV